MQDVSLYKIFPNNIKKQNQNFARSNKLMNVGTEDQRLLKSQKERQLHITDSLVKPDLQSD